MRELVMEELIVDSWTINIDKTSVYHTMTLEIIRCEHGGFRVVLTERHWDCVVYAWPYFTPEVECENTYFKNYVDARNYATDIIKGTRHDNAEVLYNDLVFKTRKGGYGLSIFRA